jgi:hypothetical protein
MASMPLAHLIAGLGDLFIVQKAVVANAGAKSKDKGIARQRGRLLVETIEHLEALAWCEEHNADIAFNSERITVIWGPRPFDRQSGATLPEAVAKAKAWLAEREADRG